ncbi:MAG TPA: TfoX/Sxy family protein [Solirubrobacteraceae bacterium]
MGAEANFDAIAARMLGEPGIEQRTAFASPGLTVGGKIFAMCSRGRLVFKLPAERCAELVAAGRGRPFESGGRAMREWVAVDDTSESEALELAGEALAFVRR